MRQVFEVFKGAEGVRLGFMGKGLSVWGLGVTVLRVESLYGSWVVPLRSYY